MIPSDSGLQSMASRGYHFEVQRISYRTSVSSRRMGARHRSDSRVLLRYSKSTNGEWAVPEAFGDQLEA
jgi:hypothetical protein